MPEINPLRARLDETRARLDALAASMDIDAKQARQRELVDRMAAPDFWNDPDAARGDVDEMKALKAVLAPVAALRADLDAAAEWLDMAAAENDEAALAETAVQIGRLPARLADVELLALLSGAHDAEPCFFGIHTGAGGADACEWAQMLLRMYSRFFERRGWKAEEIDLQEGEESGIKSVQLRVAGDFAYGCLKGEMGVHRLVRISPFSGKRETSFAAVDVVPDFQDDIHIVIEDKDLRIDTYRSGGKGGQHVNKTDSAVRITHLPTGLVVAVQNERSQHKNKDMAMKILKARLKQREEAARQSAANDHHNAKSDNAWGSQIRNYVMNPYQMVKDVRTGEETGDINRILDGDLDKFVDAVLRWSVG